MTFTPSPSAPGTGPHQVRPPCTQDHHSNPGAAESPTISATVTQRRSVSPMIESAPAEGMAATHDYVRRYWIPIIGPGAVADLLRLTAAAHSGRSLPEPVHLPALMRARLVRRQDATLFVPDTVRPLDRSLVRRLPPSIRRTHPKQVGAAGSPSQLSA